tara:strand:- start:6262 stop:6549 length:288 start_codon:yes stop_codon:yes gene_type:complete
MTMPKNVFCLKGQYVRLDTVVTFDCVQMECTSADKKWWRLEAAHAGGAVTSLTFEATDTGAQIVEDEFRDVWFAAIAPAPVAVPNNSLIRLRGGA